MELWKLHQFRRPEAVRVAWVVLPSDVLELEWRGFLVRTSEGSRPRPLDHASRARARLGFLGRLLALLLRAAERPRRRLVFGDVFVDLMPEEARAARLAGEESLERRDAHGL